MSNLSSDFDNFENFNFEDNSKINEEIERCKAIIESGAYFNSIESIEEVIEACMESDKEDEAIYFIDFMLSFSPYNSEYWLKKGIALNDIGEHEEALEYVEKALLLNPTDIEAILEKSQCYLFLENVDKALQILLDVEDNYSDNEEVMESIARYYTLKDNFPEGIKYTLIAQELSLNPIDYFPELGYLYDCIGDYQKAAEFYELAIEEIPNEANLWYCAGNMHLKMNSFEKAIYYFDFAIALSDRHHLSHFNKGNALADLKRYEEAIESFFRAIAIDKDDDEAYFNIGNIYEQMDDLAKAVLYYSESIKINNSNNPDAYLSRGNCYLTWSDYSKANSDFFTGISQAENKKEAYKEIGDNFIIAGNNKIAILYYFKAVEIDPDDFDTRFNLAELYYEEEQWDLAADSYNECIRINPADALSYYLKAKANYKMSNFLDTLESLEFALLLDSKLITDVRGDFPILQSTNSFKKLMEEL
jgi:tetratricopeptide (TPR) repeat protein